MNYMNYLIKTKPAGRDDKMNRKLKLLIIALFVGIISMSTVYAVTIIASKDVIYDNSKSKSPANNVQAAIDDLYNKAATCSIGTGGITASKVLKPGDYVSMKPTATSYTIPSSLTGYDSDQTINPSELNLWRVIKVNDDGTVEMVSEYVSSTSVYFNGKEGYINYVGALNTIASQYTNEKYVQSTRHIGYSNQIETLTDTSKIDQTTPPWTKQTSLSGQWTGCDSSNYLCGKYETEGAGDIGYETDYNLVKNALGTMIGKNASGTPVRYMLASRKYYCEDWSDYYAFTGRVTDGSGYLRGETMLAYNGGYEEAFANAVRPIVVLKSTIRIASGDGTETNPYKLTDKVVNDEPSIENLNATSSIDSINITYQANGDITTCRYGTTNGIYNNEVPGATETSCTITELSGNTTYYYQICTEKENGIKCEKRNIKTNQNTINIVKIGDYISMTPTASSYSISSSLTGYSNQTINPSELNLWRVIKVNDDGTVEMVSEYASSKSVYFKGKTGYMNFVGALNTIAAQYTNDQYVSKTRHIGYSNQTETITDTSKLDQTTPPWTVGTDGDWTAISSGFTEAEEAQGAGDIGYTIDYQLVNGGLGTMEAKTPSGTAGDYWLASRSYHYVRSNHWFFSGNYASTSGSLDSDNVHRYENRFKTPAYAHKIRPIITLKSGLIIESGDGKSAETAYQLG